MTITIESEAEQRFLEACRAHDLTYIMAEDAGTWLKGKKTEEAINKMIASGAVAQYRAYEIWNAVVDEKVVPECAGDFYIGNELPGPTPAPWKVFTIASNAGVSYRIFHEPAGGGAPVDIAHVPMEWANPRNAALLAKAPELAALLRDWVEYDANTSKCPDCQGCRYEPDTPCLHRTTLALLEALA